MEETFVNVLFLIRSTNILHYTLRLSQPSMPCTRHAVNIFLRNLDQNKNKRNSIEISPTLTVNFHERETANPVHYFLSLKSVCHRLVKMATLNGRFDEVKQILQDPSLHEL